jgi:hypothetical protein
MNYKATAKLMQKIYPVYADFTFHHLLSLPPDYTEHVLPSDFRDYVYVTVAFKLHGGDLQNIIFHCIDGVCSLE